MKTGLFAIILLIFSLSFISCDKQKSSAVIQGWTILSDNDENALEVINRAGEYHINQLQLSHQIVMNLKDLRKASRLQRVNDLTGKAHDAGIEKVFVWDHALYVLDYYPDSLRTAPGNMIDLDNPAFWAWVKNDYRQLLDLIPDVDGIVLTFIETGAHVEDQYSTILKTREAKLAALVDTLAGVIMDEKGKELILRTFSYSREELRSVIAAVNSIKHPGIVVMTKETPHDFYLTHPVSHFVDQIKHPVIIEFDAAHEYNGQGIITSIFPALQLKRLRFYQKQSNFAGYVARTDRLNNTCILDNPAEVNLLALSRGMEDTTVTAGQVIDEFITTKYGSKTVPVLHDAFNRASDVILSVFYTLGLNTNTHSRLDYEDDSGYQRAVSGKWKKNQEIYIDHGVDRSFHYWKDIVNHLSPAWYKGEQSNQLAVESHWVLDSAWMQPVEMMNARYLNYILTEKGYGVRLARENLSLVDSAKALTTHPGNYKILHDVFERTYLTACLYKATAQVYFGYRVWYQGDHGNGLSATISEGMSDIKSLVPVYLNYPDKGPVGQFDWTGDIYRAMIYYNYVKENLDKPYTGDIFGFIPFSGLTPESRKEIYQKFLINLKN
ncbi:MAG TPA: hypothetical protein VE870_00295 [Bacteroidales bacterium]|nr:hypothetical protein [Bacteroidales bacterium]